MYWTVFLVRECNLETEQGKTALYPSGDVKFYFEAVNGFALSLVLVTNRPQKFDLCVPGCFTVGGTLHCLGTIGKTVKRGNIKLTVKTVNVVGFYFLLKVVLSVVLV